MVLDDKPRPWGLVVVVRAHARARAWMRACVCRGAGSTLTPESMGSLRSEEEGVSLPSLHSQTSPDKWNVT